MSGSELTEIFQFLTLDSRIDVKSLALHHILGLTGTKEGRELLKGHIGSICKHLFVLLDDLQPAVAKDALLALLNLAADKDLVPEITSNCQSEIEKLVHNIILNPESNLADPACAFLANLTRPKLGTEAVYPLLEKDLDKIVDAFCQESFNKKGANLHHLASVLSNLSQLPSMRNYLLDQSKCMLQRLVTFTDYEKSIIRKGGVIGLLKNCCFDPEHHEWLLSEAVDILPKLLLPLAGPEEFTDEENDKLPMELQYLGEEKLREEDADLRKMLIEALTQLCATKFGREYLRSKNAYVILRELHKWEKDREAFIACENLVDILIKYEHEIGYDNLKEVEVPEDVAKKFEEFDTHIVHGQVRFLRSAIAVQNNVCCLVQFQVGKHCRDFCCFLHGQKVARFTCGLDGCLPSTL
nr:EOG090X08WK [Eulimnadia texana]